ncbi:MAG: DNA translocase FtsK, partial [Firmicutes bacterium]|nr:DNA translocase FtsK [Bacillota bacterium]
QAQAHEEDGEVAAPVEFAAIGDETHSGSSEVDELFAQAVRIVVESRQASASMLQRRMRIGYTRAARLIDGMEERGYIGPSDGAKARAVNLTLEQYRRIFEGEDSSA